MHTIEKRFSKEVYKKKEAAEILSVSPATIDRMRVDGTLRAKKVRGQVMIPRNELIRYLSEL